jgi:hypothetical protein
MGKRNIQRPDIFNFPQASPQGLLGKPVGTRSLGRPKRRWEDNINMDVQEVGWGCGDWLERAQDRDR